MKRNHDRRSVRKNGVVYLFVLVLAGVAVGSVLRMLRQSMPLWDDAFFLQGIGFPETTDFGNVLVSCTLIPLLWLALYAALGLSLAGIPGAAGLLMLRGAALGGALSEMYLMEGSGCLLDVLVFVMPNAFLGTLLFTLAARETIRAGVRMAQLVFLRTQEGTLPLRLYALRFLVLAVSLLLLGVLQSCLLYYIHPGV